MFVYTPILLRYLKYILESLYKISNQVNLFRFRYLQFDGITFFKP